MSRLEDCCFTCRCGFVSCGDNNGDCGCLDEPTCQDCHNFHFDLTAQDKAFSEWLRKGWAA